MSFPLMISENDLLNLRARITKNSKNDNGFDEEGTMFLFTKIPWNIELIIFKHIMKTLGYHIHIVPRHMYEENIDGLGYGYRKFGTLIYTNYPYVKIKELHEECTLDKFDDW